MCMSHCFHYIPQGYFFLIVGALLEDTFDIVMLKFICDALEPMLASPLAKLSGLPKTVNEFLKTLTKSVGPIFIVLDEIGSAFEADELSDTQMREQFLSFCSNIIGKWLLLKDVFFVLLGRASFFSYVGRRPVNVNILKSTYDFERLNIHLLRPEASKSILEKT
jgi:hypothetical protein